MSLTTLEIDESATFPLPDEGVDTYPYYKVPYVSIGEEVKLGAIISESESLGKNEGATITFRKYENSSKYPDSLISNIDDPLLSIARGRLKDLEVQYTVEKKYDNETQVTYLDVINIEYFGEVQDLYDFNHDTGGFARNAAILQIGYGSGKYNNERNRGIIYRSKILFRESIDPDY